jgi:hypothetical protein
MTGLMPMVLLKRKMENKNYYTVRIGSKSNMITVERQKYISKIYTSPGYLLASYR